MNAQELQRLGSAIVSIYGKDVPLRDVFLVKPPPQGGKAASPALTFDLDKLAAITGEQIGVYTAITLVGNLLEAATRIMGRRKGERDLLLVNNSTLNRGTIENGQFKRLGAGDRLPQGQAQVYQANFGKGAIVAWLNSCGTSAEAHKAAAEVFGVYSDQPQQQAAPQPAFNPMALEVEPFAAWALEKASGLDEEQMKALESLIDSLESAKLVGRMRLKAEIVALVEGKGAEAAQPTQQATHEARWTPSEPAQTRNEPVSTTADDEIPF